MLNLKISAIKHAQQWQSMVVLFKSLPNASYLNTHQRRAANDTITTQQVLFTNKVTAPNIGLAYIIKHWILTVFS